MRKALKRSLSLLLAITIIFSSAYAGLGEVDWGSVFAVKASAADMGDDCIKIILTWGSTPSDLDSHVSGTLADGTSFHCYYKNKNIYYDGDLVVNLDKDDTSSYGPETTTITLDPSVFDGEFTYYVYNYSGTGSIPNSGATVSLYKGDTFIGAYDASGSSSGRYWSLFYIKKGIIYLVDEIGSSVSKNINESTDVIGNVWGEVFNTPERIDPNSYKIKVIATDKDGYEVPGARADVTVYFGADAVLTKSADEAGNVTFTIKELIEKGVPYEDLFKCTVSAHLQLGNGLELCSEFVNYRGVWEGAALASEVILDVDEPRWKPSLRVMINESDVELCKTILREYSREFAQSTNGHVIINNFNLVIVSDTYTSEDAEDVENLAKSRNVDICMVRHSDGGAWGNVWPLKGDKGSLDNCLPGYTTEFRNKVGYKGIIWCPVNNDYCSSTLCHESGHYLFGFLDEYASAIGYYGARNNLWTYSIDKGLYSYDYTGASGGGPDGKITAEEEYAAYWGKNYYGNSSVGKINRPKDEPINFGLMEIQYANAEAIEMSGPSTYAGVLSTIDDYNELINDTNKIHPYTQQYYYSNASCEEKMFYQLNLLAEKNNRSTFYRYASEKQRAEYWYAGYDNVSFSPSRINTASDMALGDFANTKMSSASGFAEIEYGCDFSYDGSALIITSLNVMDISVVDFNGTTVFSTTLDEDNNYSASFETTINSNYKIFTTESINGEKIVKKYHLKNKLVNSDFNFDNSSPTVSLHSENESRAVIIHNDEIIRNGEYSSVNGQYNIVSNNANETAGGLQTSLSYDLGIDYSSLSWFYMPDSEWVALETNYFIDDDNQPNFSCAFVGNGKYCLMAKTASEETINTPTNLNVTTEGQTADGEVLVQFTDNNTDILNYNVYYSAEPITTDNYEEAERVIVSAGRKEAYITVGDVGSRYYFAVQAVAISGAKSEISESVSCTSSHIDSDNDGIPDYWLDIYYQLKEIENIAYTDYDEDGLVNLKEYESGSNPLNPDTDGDNVYDGIELSKNLNPLVPMTDGETDDYTVAYGAPDLKVSHVTFDNKNIYFKVRNQTNGKAMRTIVNVISGGSIVDSWTVNVDSNSVVDFSFDRSFIGTNSGFKIEVDGSQCTRDMDYSNNNFEYVPATNITLEDVTIVKDFSTPLKFICEPNTANEIYKWKYISGSPNISINENTGVVSSSGIGQALIQVETLGGLTADCTVTAVPFEGSEYTEFDCEIINDGTELAIIGYIGNDTDITIPDSIGSLPVTQLNDDCIPSGVTNVTVPASVSVISYNAFYGCGTLSSINVDENNSSYSSADGVLFNKDKTELILYPRNKACSEYVVPNGVIAVMNNAFENCTNLTMVTVSDSVECIGDFAFSDSTNLSSVIISDGVTSIGYAAFLNCERLTSINVDEDNAGFSSIDGVLFNKDKTTLIQYPAGKTDVRYTIPDSVTAIDDMAFMGCSKLGELVISDNLESIGEEAITQCSSLKYVFYQGSESDWSNVSIGIDNGSLTTAKIHYNTADHIYEYKVDKEATCTNDGLKHLECTVCTYCLDPEIIPSPGHDYSTEWTIDVAPTCTEKGSKSHHCTVCDDKSDVTVISILEHEMVNDICKYCGLSDVWEYEMKDGSIVITQYNGNSSEVVIPSEICGVPVIGIGDNLFYNCTSLTSITIPESVTTIGNYAFYNCSGLKTITISDKVTTIGNYAFASCTGLTSIVIPDSVTKVGVGAFYECGFLRSVVMSKNITEINESTFYNCYYLSSFTIPEGVTTIGNTAFYGCMRLVSVDIPDSVTSIGNGAFSGCKKITSLDIGDNITSIGNSAFYGCTSLTSINIPDSITTINPYTFYNCKNVSYVIISDRVEGIGKNAFYGFTGTIYCVENSVAHEYVVANGLSYILLNSIVNTVDTSNTQIDYSNFVIRTSVQGCNDISEIIGKSQSAIVVATPSYEYNELKIYGTGTTITVFDGDNYIGEFTVVVDCDINGDSVVDVLDSSQMALASSGKKTLDGAYALAGDSNSDDIIDISDYQDVVNKAVS